ncbi:MAG: hypothetical protein ABSD74_06380 [Rhizomicrobium sp.]
MLLATFLAAFAASMSTYAAFRQERATFTSALYAKQIDAVSAYFQESASYLQRWQTLNGKVDLFLQRGQGDPDELVKEVEGNRADELRVAVAFEQASLVLPKDFRRLANAAQDQIDTTSESLSELWSECFDPGRKKSTCSPSDAARRADGTGSTVNKISVSMDELERCSYAYFSQGQFLVDGSLGSCEHAGN